MVQIKTRKVVNFKEFLIGIGMNPAQSAGVLDDLKNSEVSFGTNPDTLLDVNAVEKFITPYGFKVPEEFDNPENPMWFSLGS
jgi:hypothetical protein